MRTLMNLALTMVSSVMISQTVLAASKGEQNIEKDVQVGFSDAYIPSGFDSNSDAFIVANGIFPNGCYRWKEANVTHISETNHEVRATASVSQGMCLMVLVPFSKEIRLGKLSVGSHFIRLMNGDGTFIEKKINIEE